VWSAEARSPDGRWLATAETEQTSGFGTGYVWTEVYLKRASIFSLSSLILQFDHDPDNASPTIGLALKWVTSSHLEVTYTGRAKITRHVADSGGVEISVRSFSNNEPNGSK
jgi:hypothetical protein